MTPIHTQLHNEAQNVQLSRTERDQLREGILEYMAYKPMRESQAAATATHGGFGAFFRAHHLAGALAIALIVTTSTVSVGSAASDALPGDLLYPVKVHVNEGVKTVFITGDEARIAWERERAETRLREAAQLASEGRLDGKRKEEVEKRFVAHSEALVEQVRNVEESDPVLAAIASSEFEESLETHEVALTRLADEQADDTQESVRAIAEHVHAAAQSAVEVREAAEEKIVRELEESEVPEEDGDLLATDTTGQTADTGEEAAGAVAEGAHEVAAEDAAEAAATGEASEARYSAPKTRSPDLRIRTAYRAQESAQEQLARAQELLASLDEASELRAPARAQLASGNTHLADAEAALAADDYSTAYRAYRSAAVKFQKVAELLQVRELFSVDVTALAGDESGDTAELEAIAAFLDVPVVNEIPDGEPEEPPVHRARVQATIEEAQHLLLQHEGYDAEDLEDAYRHIARAERALLRGDIYRALDNADAASRFYDEAERGLTDTLNTLQDSLRSDSVQEVPQITPEEAAVAAEASTTVQVMHTFEDGVHTYSGTLSVATSCTDVVATLVVAESYPEQLTLTLTTSEQVEGCEVPEPRALFTASTTASGEAVLVEVIVDEISVPFELVLPEEGATDDAAATPQQKAPTFMEHTFEQAQRLFGGE